MEKETPTVGYVRIGRAEFLIYFITYIHVLFIKKDRTTLKVKDKVAFLLSDAH